MPPEKEYTEHYRKQYQLGAEEPLDIDSCELPNSPSDDALTRDDLVSGLRRLNANRQTGHDNCAPEYLKRGRFCAAPVVNSADDAHMVVCL